MSPRAGQTRPDSLRTDLRVWLVRHSGWHSPADLYPDFPDEDRQAIRNELKRLADAEDGVIRYRSPDAPAKGPGTKYARPGTPPVAS